MFDIAYNNCGSVHKIEKRERTGTINGIKTKEMIIFNNIYREISNISRIKFQNKIFSRLGFQLSVQYMDARGKVDNEYVGGAAPTGDAPTTFEWSTI